MLGRRWPAHLHGQGLLSSPPMVEGRTSHSRMGTASFALASLSGLLLAGLALVARSLEDWNPRGTR